MPRLALIRWDVGLLVRSPGYWVTAVAFAATVALGALLPTLAFENPDPRLGAAFLLGPGTDILLPAIAIIFGHGAIAGRRETGALTGLLAMPYRRAELFVALSLARVVAIAALTILGTLVGVFTVWLAYGEIPAVRIGGFVLATGLAAASYTAIAVAISATVRTRSRALGILLGGYVVAYALWEPLLDGIRLTDLGRSMAQELEAVERANPLAAYGTIADVILPATPHVQLAFDAGELAAEQGAYVGSAAPHVSELTGPVLVLLGWALCATILGGIRFRRLDLV